MSAEIVSKPKGRRTGQVEGFSPPRGPKQNNESKTRYNADGEGRMTREKRMT